MATNPYFSWADRSAAERYSAELARSGRLNRVLDEIAAGFDAIDAEAFAPLASPAFTGTPTAPTPALSTNTTQIPTTAWVNSLIGSLTVGLPSQLTHGGKVLWTDGTSASWALPIASQTGHSGKYLTTNGTTESWGDIVALGIGGGFTAYSSGATHSGTTRMLDLRAANGGTVVQLPAGTSLPVGTMFWVHGSGTVTGTAGVADGSGELLDVAPAAAPEILHLTDNSTTAGTWKRALGTDGYLLRDLATARSVLGASTTLLASWTIAQTLPVTGQSDVFLVAGAAGASSGLKLQLITATGNAIAATGSTTTIGTATIVWLKLFTNTNGYIVVYASSGTVYAVGLTISGSTITASSATTVTTWTPYDTTYEDLAAGYVEQKVLVCYRNGATTHSCRTVFFSAVDTPVAGTAASLGSGNSTNGCTLDCIGVSTDKFFVTWGTADTSGTSWQTRSLIVTNSGTTASANSLVVHTQTTYNIGTYHCQTRALLLDTSRVLVVARQIVGSGAVSGEIGATVTSISGTTVTMNANVDLYGGASGAHAGVALGRVDAVAVGSYYYVGATDSGDGMGQAISISGTTITRVGSVSTAVDAAQETMQHPVAVNGYLAIPNGTGYGLYTVDGSGITSVMTITDTYGHAMPSGIGAMGDLCVHKLASGKRYLSVSAGSALTSRVTQYGGIS